MASSCRCLVSLSFKVLQQSKFQYIVLSMTPNVVFFTFFLDFDRERVVRSRVFYRSCGYISFSPSQRVAFCSMILVSVWVCGKCRCRACIMDGNLLLNYMNVDQNVRRSQEIWHKCAVVLALRRLWDCLEDDEIAIRVLVKVEECGFVVHAVAVVWGRPQSHQLFVEPVNVPFLHQLMGPNYQRQVVQQIEVVHYLVPENPPRSSRVTPPSLDILRVRPHEVSQRAFIGDFLLSIKQSHLVDGGQVGGESSVHAEHVAVDDGSEGEEVKGLIKKFPAVGVAVLLVDLIEEAVHHGDVPALVVSPEQVDAVGVLHLQAEKERDGLDGVVAAVDEVSDEDELVVGDTAALGDQVLHVVELAVDVACDVHRGVHAHDVRLLGEDAFDKVAEGANGRFCDGFAGQS